MQTPGCVEFFSFIYGAFIPYIYLSLFLGCLGRLPVETVSPEARVALTSDSVLWTELGAPFLFADIALLGGVPKDTAAAVFSAFLGADDRRTVAALPWWADQQDTVSLRSFLRRTERKLHAGLPPEELGWWRNAREASIAYVTLIRRDTSEALRRLTSATDSVCFYCIAERLRRAELLSARGQTQEAAALLRPRALYTWAWPLEPLWRLQRGRVSERLGNREQAIADYGFAADVWRNADPELQPYVAEARAALKRLGGEPRR